MLTCPLSSKQLSDLRLRRTTDEESCFRVATEHHGGVIRRRLNSSAQQRLRHKCVLGKVQIRSNQRRQAGGPCDVTASHTNGLRPVSPSHARAIHEEVQLHLRRRG